MCWGAACCRVNAATEEQVRHVTRGHRSNASTPVLPVFPPPTSILGQGGQWEKQGWWW